MPIYNNKLSYATTGSKLVQFYRQKHPSINHSFSTAPFSNRQEHRLPNPQLPAKTAFYRVTHSNIL